MFKNEFLIKYTEFVYGIYRNLGSDSFLLVGCFSFVASESSFFVGQTFWSSLSFFVGMLTFGCLTPNEPELIDNFGCNRWP
ncbi:uncharacterized protein OCT59_024348 [Rhizophagus irregularis]|uniref:uncharacterized protein n=1 Tax=Rhizophagus irregularis TaxID=588596 RepID=UPI0033279937|nr:hypothetical protein OCT59_024348 [Rhizophagus irregularis]